MVDKQQLKEFYNKYSTGIKLVLFILYVAIAASIFSNLEGWSGIDAVYFVIVTTTTVGYGFFVPTTPKAKVLTIFLILFGVFVVLAILNDFATTVLLAAQEEFLHNIQLALGRPALAKNEIKLYKIVSSLSMIFILGLGGALFYASNEGWTALDAIYWVIETMTTVGYGEAGFH
jgi:voltage-gated potassium channel Kch